MGRGLNNQYESASADFDIMYRVSASPFVVPEPATFVLLLTALPLGSVFFLRRLVKSRR